jgi:fructose-1,6-bisphosphatase/sedoheptulose 1,7-bisphosphatase-like protein
MIAVRDGDVPTALAMCMVVRNVFLVGGSLALIHVVVVDLVQVSVVDVVHVAVVGDGNVPAALAVCVFVRGVDRVVRCGGHVAHDSPSRPPARCRPCASWTGDLDSAPSLIRVSEKNY